MLPSFFGSSLLACAVLVSVPTSLAQSVYSIAIDTAEVRGASGKLVFAVTSNRPLVNRVDIVNFVTDGSLGLPETEGTLVSGDLIQGLNPARFTRIKAYTFLTELAIPFTAYGNTIQFVVNVSETAPREDIPPDQLSVYLLDQEGRRLTRRRVRDTRPEFAITITGDRGGRLEVAGQKKVGAAGPEDDTLPENTPARDAETRANAMVRVQITPAWTADDPAVDEAAKTFEGNLSEFCNRRCDGALICTGGAFGISVNEDTFYTFDDIGNLKTQVALVDAGRNPLGEGPVGQAKVVGILNGSVLTVRKVEIF
jgi:hypothetical protein